MKFVLKVKRGSGLDADKVTSFSSFMNLLCSTKFQRLVPSIEWVFVTWQKFITQSNPNQCLSQESPPAWTQEAYRPRRIKYSIYYPVRGGVAPPAPPPGQVWLEVPEVGYPPVGVPPARSNGGTRGGVPHQSTPWSGPPPTWTWLGYPLGVDRQNDGQTRVKTLPSRRTTYAVGNKVQVLILPRISVVGSMDCIFSRAASHEQSDLSGHYGVSLFNTCFGARR